jgi:hypothetical protein
MLIGVRWANLTNCVRNHLRRFEPRHVKRLARLLQPCGKIRTKILGEGWIHRECKECN